MKLREQDFLLEKIKTQVTRNVSLILATRSIACYEQLVKFIQLTMNVYTKHRRINVSISSTLKSYFRDIEYLTKFTNFTKFYIPEDIKCVDSAHYRKRNVASSTLKKSNVVTYTFSSPETKLFLKEIPRFEGTVL